MKIVVNRPEFVGKLNIAKKTTSARPIIPHTGNILLEAKKKVVHIASTDTLYSTFQIIDAEISGDGISAMTAPAEILCAVISNMTGEEVTLEFVNDGIKISSGKAKTTIKGLPANDFPSLPIKGTVLIRLYPEAVTVLQKLIAPFTAPDNSDSGVSNPNVTGVKIAVDGNKLYFVSANSFQAAFWEQECTCDDFAVVVPSRVIKEMRGECELWLSKNQNQIIMTCEGIEFASTMLDSKSFPAVERFKRTDHTTTFTAKANELLDAARLLMVVSNNVNHQIDVVVKGDTIKLRSVDKQKGTGAVDVKCVSDGEELTVGLSGNLLVTTLSAIGTRNAVFNCSGTHGTVQVTIEGEPNYTHIVMPLTTVQPEE